MPRFSTAYAVAAVIGIILGIVIFSVFMPPRKRGKYLHSPSLLVIHDYLNFKKMIAIWFVKLGYVIAACVLSLYAVVMMFDDNFFLGFAVLTVGNIVLRIAQELSVVLLSIHSNLNTITDAITGRQQDEAANVSFGQFFGDMGSQIKQKQEQLRARAEAERQQYGQYGQQGQGQGQPYAGQGQGQPYAQPGPAGQQYTQPGPAERQYAGQGHGQQPYAGQGPGQQYGYPAGQQPVPPPPPPPPPSEYYTQPGESTAGPVPPPPPPPNL